MRVTTLAATAALIAGFAGAAVAADYKTGSITVSNPWARASMGMARAGAAFMTLKNDGSVDDTLVSAAANVAKKVELHTHIMANGIMKMRRVEGGIPVPAGSMTMLKPGGYHVMFMGLKAPFREGGSFPLTLTFARAGKVKVTVEIKSGAAMGHGMKKDMKTTN
jgi:copper(I)-binding protein